MDKLVPFSLKTFAVSFWMRKFSSSTWKRTAVISNRRMIHRLDRGKLSEDEKRCTVKTVKKFVDKKGVSRWVGSEHLKKSEPLACSIVLSCELLGLANIGKTTVPMFYWLRQYTAPFAAEIIKLAAQSPQEDEHHGHVSRLSVAR